MQQSVPVQARAQRQAVLHEKRSASRLLPCALRHWQPHALQRTSCLLTHLSSHVSAADCQHNAAGRNAPQMHGKLTYVARTMCANVYLL